MSAINAAGSAFCAFCFYPDFFDLYELDGGRKRVDLVLHIRTLQNVLKMQLNRRLEKCELLLLENEVENRLVVRLHNFNGVTKTHKLTFEDRKSMFPASPTSASMVTMEAKTIQKLLDHFGSRSSGEISLVCRLNDLTIKSKLDDFVDKGSKMSRLVTTEVRVDHRQFRTYKVGVEVELSFATREFKAAIALADHLSLPLELNFSHAGAPLIINLHCPTMTAQIFIATSMPTVVGDSQPTTASQGVSQEGQDDEAVEHANQPPAEEEEEEEEGEREEEGTMMEQDFQHSFAEPDTEVIHSGRSATNAVGPMQSTAIPRSSLVQSGQNAHNHGGPSISTPPPPPPLAAQGKQREQQPLFFPYSSQENVNDGAVMQESDEPDTTEEERHHIDLTRQQQEMDRQLEIELQLEEEQRRAQEKSEALKPRAPSPGLSDLMSASPFAQPVMEGTLFEEREVNKGGDKEEEEIEEEEEDTLSFDGEELPSTQLESSSKKTKFESLF